MLDEVSRALLSTVEVDEVLERVARLLVPRLADWCLADLAEPGDLVRRVAWQARDASLPPPPGADRPAARRTGLTAAGVLRDWSGTETPLHRTAEDIAGWHDDEDETLRAQAALLAGLGTREVVVLPVLGRSGLLAVLTVGRTAADPSYTRSDLDLLREVASRTGLALEAALARRSQRQLVESVQKSLLGPLPRGRGFRVAARYRGARQGPEVGGDWYDAFVLPHGQLGAVIGDAAGHDLSALAVMTQLRNTVRTVAVDRGEPPHLVLARVNRVMAHLGLDELVTCLYAVLEPGSGPPRWEWASAGHHPPLLLRRGAVQVLPVDPAPPLGSPGEHVARLQSVPAEPGDVLLLYTDGVVEDRAHQLERGPDALRDLAAEPSAGVEALLDRVLHELANPDDDSALLAVTYLG